VCGEPETQGERGKGQGDCYGNKAPWRRNQEDEEGPDHIELLLDVERPKVDEVYAAAEIEVPANRVSVEQDMVAIGKQAPLLSSPMDVEKGCAGEEDKENSVVERKDAENTPRIKVSKEAWSRDGFDENSGYEKTGEGEEDVYAAPKRVSKSAGPNIDRSLWTSIDEEKMVAKHH